MRSLKPSEREQYSHILRFKEAFPGFPDGILCFDDNPDILIKTPEGIWGIEHTRLCSEEMKKEESFEQQIVDRAKGMFESSGAPPLCVTVLFDSRPRWKDRDSIAASLNGIVNRNMPNVGEHRELEGWRFFSQGLTRTIKMIFIDRPANLCETTWSVARSSAVPHLAPQQIRERIQGKETKLREYLNKCSKIWLLIVEDGFAPSGHFVISDEVKQQVYRSRFDRIFLFRNLSCEAFELNVPP